MAKGPQETRLEQAVTGIGIAEVSSPRRSGTSGCQAPPAGGRRRCARPHRRCSPTSAARPGRPPRRPSTRWPTKADERAEEMSTASAALADTRGRCRTPRRSHRSLGERAVRTAEAPSPPGADVRRRGPHAASRPTATRSSSYNTAMADREARSQGGRRRPRRRVRRSTGRHEAGPRRARPAAAQRRVRRRWGCRRRGGAGGAGGAGGTRPGDGRRAGLRYGDVSRTYERAPGARRTRPSPPGRCRPTDARHRSCRWPRPEPRVAARRRARLPSGERDRWHPLLIGRRPPRPDGRRSRRCRRRRADGRRGRDRRRGPRRWRGIHRRTDRCRAAAGGRSIGSSARTDRHDEWRPRPGDRCGRSHRPHRHCRHRRCRRSPGRPFRRHRRPRGGGRRAGAAAEGWPRCRRARRGSVGGRGTAAGAAGQAGSRGSGARGAGAGAVPPARPAARARAKDKRSSENGTSSSRSVQDWIDDEGMAPGVID